MLISNINFKKLKFFELALAFYVFLFLFFGSLIFILKYTRSTPFKVIFLLELKLFIILSFTNNTFLLFSTYGFKNFLTGCFSNTGRLFNSNLFFPFFS